MTPSNLNKIEWSHLRWESLSRYRDDSESNSGVASYIVLRTSTSRSLPLVASDSQTVIADQNRDLLLFSVERSQLSANQKQTLRPDRPQVESDVKSYLNIANDLLQSPSTGVFPDQPSAVRAWQGSQGAQQEYFAWQANRRLYFLVLVKINDLEEELPFISLSRLIETHGNPPAEIIEDWSRQSRRNDLSSLPADAIYVQSDGQLVDPLQTLSTTFKNGSATSVEPSSIHLAIKSIEGSMSTQDQSSFHAVSVADTLRKLSPTRSVSSARENTFEPVFDDAEDDFAIAEFSATRDRSKAKVSRAKPGLSVRDPKVIFFGLSVILFLIACKFYFWPTQRILTGPSDQQYLKNSSPNSIQNTASTAPQVETDLGIDLNDNDSSRSTVEQLTLEPIDASAFAVGEQKEPIESQLTADLKLDNWEKAIESNLLGGRKLDKGGVSTEEPSSNDDENLEIADSQLNAKALEDIASLTADSKALASPLDKLAKNNDRAKEEFERDISSTTSASDRSESLGDPSENVDANESKDATVVSRQTTELKFSKSVQKISVPVKFAVSEKIGSCIFKWIVPNDMLVTPAEAVDIKGKGAQTWSIALKDEGVKLLVTARSSPSKKWSLSTWVRVQMKDGSEYSIVAAQASGMRDQWNFFLAELKRRELYLQTIRNSRKGRVIAAQLLPMVETQKFDVTTAADLWDQAAILLDVFQHQATLQVELLNSREHN